MIGKCYNSKAISIRLTQFGLEGSFDPNIISLRNGDEGLLIGILGIAAAFSGVWMAIILGLLKLLSSKHPRTLNEIKEKENAKKEVIAGIGSIIIFIMTTICIILFFKDENSERTDLAIETETFLESEEIESAPRENIYVERRYGGAVYKGYINLETEEPNGQGTMEYDKGEKYTGNWVNGVREGHGYAQYSNGDIYDGEWKDGKRDGIGTYTWKNGEKYIGQFANDFRNGEGKYIGWTGFVSTYGFAGNYDGISKNNMFEGKGRFEFDNGDVFEGIFNSNKLWTGTYTRKNGSEYKIIEGKPSN